MKNFGLGCMRFPRIDGDIDIAQTTQMVDYCMQHGFNYFDTAHGYLDGKSETALREALTSRYPRESYILTNKLSGHFYNSQEQIRPLFEEQLKACGVEYFDYYLMHAQNAESYAHCKRCNAYETSLELMAEGKFRHFGISFHDKAEVLEQILNEYPQIEVVQIQFNYVDYEDPSVESRRCYEVCRKHGKQVIVMEPIKGGSLITLPEEASAILNGLGVSPANLAIRFAASFEGIMMVLSGMGNMEQVIENTSFMEDFAPLNETEMAAIDRIREIFHAQNLIPCTACRYCTEVCPQSIPIPDLFACMNAKKLYHNWNTDYYYNSVHTSRGGKASDCIECGQCEHICPQHLEIRRLLKDVAEEFDKK